MDTSKGSPLCAAAVLAFTMSQAALAATPAELLAAMERSARARRAASDSRTP